MGRKATGGKYNARRKKKLYERPGQRRITKLGDTIIFIAPASTAMKKE